MTRGGVRKGAGRPKSKDEKRTANLCGVRVKPSRKLAYVDIARAHAITVTKLIETVMDVFLADVQESEVGVAYDSLCSEHAALDIDKIYAGYVEELKRKRRGKK